MPRQRIELELTLVPGSPSGGWHAELRERGRRESLHFSDPARLAEYLRTLGGQPAAPRGLR